MSARRFTSMALASLCALAGGLALSAPASALYRHEFSATFGEKGSGNGQFEDPEGVAVNDTTHDVYVVDRGNNRVEEFTSTGTYIGQFNGSAAPTGQFSGPTEVAIDNSSNPLDPSAGDVYVIDSGHSVIDKFTASGTYVGQLKEGEGGAPFNGLRGVAVDPAGVVWVLDGNVIDNFNDALTNAFVSSRVVQEPGRNHIGHGLAVDSEDDLYIAGNEYYGDSAMKLNSSGETLVIEMESNLSVYGVATDASNNDAYLAERGAVAAYGSVPQLNQFRQKVGVLLERFGSEHLTSSTGVSVDSSSHAVYVADAGADRVASFDWVLLPDVAISEEPPVQEHEGSATFEGTVNPDGVPVTSCNFEYVEEAEYKPESPDPYEAGHKAACEPAPGSGSSAVAVHAVVTGLTPLTVYYYRLVAGNTNGSNAGQSNKFFAAEPPAIDGDSVAGVTTNSVTFKALVSAGGIATTYRFEYGPTAAYGTSLTGYAGSGSGEVQVSAHQQDLQPDTVYHFRVLAINALGTSEGADETFTTQSAATGVALPDGREWEMVTPPNKHGAALYAAGYGEGADIQAAADGGALTYTASAPLVTNSAGSRSPEEDQILSTREAPGSWTTADITTPDNEGPGGFDLGQIAAYKLFSSDLSLGLVEPYGKTPLPPLPAGSEDTIYLREASGAYKGLVTSANVPPGTKLDLKEGEELPAAGFVSASPDLRHVVVSSEVPLEEGVPPGQAELYEWAEGHLQLASVMPGPGNKPAVGEGVVLGAGGGRETGVVRNAISNDGSRIVWSTGYSEREGGRLYMRDMARKETIQVDAAQEAPEPSATRVSIYQTANTEDSRVFFTSPDALTKGSTAGGQAGIPDLYVFEVTSGAGEPLKGELTDLTVDPHAGETANVQGVIGASEDGSYVYFVAEGALGDATQSGNNLYVEHYDEATKTWSAPRFIAAPANGDANSWNSMANSLKALTSRVSPNGRYLAFMSEASLTGYENRDANSGVPDEEVFLYDADSGRVVCASCDPTGARPQGVTEPNDEFLFWDDAKLWDEHWVAANIPGWTPEALGGSLVQPRYLSNAGRLFFNSSDALVPGDVNGNEDVYEYEPAGVPAGELACSPSSTSASVVYSPSADGCVGLISAGTSPQESVFMDASEAGGDVFFLTTSKLSPQDYDQSYDIYDAHECTAASPCAPPAPLSRPPCTTGDACKAAPTPQPTLYGAPSSETFSGAGNITSTPPAVGKPKAKSVKCRRGDVKRHGACVKKRPGRAVKSKRPRKTNRRGR